MSGSFNTTPRLVKRPSAPPAPAQPTEEELRERTHPTKLKRTRGRHRSEDVNIPGQAPKNQFPYWVVWAHKRRVPRFRHPSEAAARIEAARLAELYHGVRFFVARVEDVACIPKEAAT